MKNGVLDGVIVTWSLALHCLGSLALAAGFIYWLDGRHFNINREQLVPLVDGTSISLNTEWYRAPLHVQPDVTTAISGLLRLLAIIADAWAASLCWRVIMLLAETSKAGLNRSEIEWVASYGTLPPLSHFRLSLNPILGIILLFTLARNVGSPILTGSVAWVPSNSILKLPDWPTIPISGVNASSGASFDDVNTAAIRMNLASILNTAWGTGVEEGIFKRVVPSAGLLNVGSTIHNVTLPYFSITNITWLPNPPTDLTDRFKSMTGNDSTFPDLGEQMSQSGAIALLANTTWRDNNTHGIQGTWTLLLNVVGSYRAYRKNATCDLDRTVLTHDPEVPYQNGNGTWDAPGCFAIANVSFIAGSGICEGCRVASNFTVQTTELKMLGDSYISVERALADMPVHVPSLAPLLGSFPDPTNGINNYVSALLVRSYSALWNAWTDAADPIQAARDPTTLQSEYQPAFPTLQARINKTRVYIWLGIQLLLTFAGLAFLFLQVGSCTSHITDTGMLAFDIDSRQVSKPNRKSFKDIFKGIFKTVLGAFSKNKAIPEEHEAEVMLKAVCESEKNAWKIVPVQASQDHGN
ncbi:transmembrane protein, putative [Rhizoctonia solani AG-3 Rhs1AP]|uniref:Transmembrane protein, putative n=1 Tax=Rhizoctonia solani AG-3 Rhs1AP TaxID=1086054 RepID=X8J699_9AGAM|nr:transmembrane protein, putative [Rhizoctonia solani AG-3 Rhs1AP]